MLITEERAILFFGGRLSKTLNGKLKALKREVLSELRQGLRICTKKGIYRRLKDRSLYFQTVHIRQ